MYHTDLTAELAAHLVDVTIVMPCLNETQSLPHCIANAQAALDRIAAELGLTGEIVIADNGSTDGSQALAQQLGARVVAVADRGYGAALIGGCSDARGRYILMGDCDGSYDFTDGVAMIAKLDAGFELCMGSRFAERGSISTGAMPWKNRYIGNPVLTGILNLFFRSGIDDAHCGLRAISADAFARLKLSGAGMEFASEMVIKASLLKLRMTQVPAKLLPDLRQRAPHLRPFRDGWRHLRYLFMLSPTWLFGVPSLIAMSAASLVFLVAALHGLGVLAGESMFGTSWTIVAGFVFTAGHLSGVMAVATHLHGVSAGYRQLDRRLKRFGRVLTLENVLLGGIALLAVGLTGFAAITIGWGNHGFTRLASTLPLVLVATLGTVGVQTVLGGFMLAIIGGNEAKFVAVHTLAGPLDGLACSSVKIAVPAE